MLIEPFLSHELKCYPRDPPDLLHAEGAGRNGGQEPGLLSANLAEPLMSWVTLDKSPSLSVPQFPQL